MRRAALICSAFAALAVPAAASASHLAAGDGTLVVRSGEAPFTFGAGKDVPVVQLTITGSVIGQVLNGGKIVIDAGLKGTPPEVTGAGNPHTSTKDNSVQWWQSNDTFKFRAVNGHFTILIYGSLVNVFAVGTGTVQLAGMPDTPKGDGRYSLNGDDFKSLPGSQTGKLVIGDNS